MQGAKPGPVIGLRADMDALPVKERVDLSFASKDKGIYNGEEVDVIDESGMKAGTKAICYLVIDYLKTNKKMVQR